MRSLALLLLLATAACTRTPPPQAPVQPQQSWEEFTRDHPDTFIQSYAASIGKDAAQLRSAGLADDLAVVRAQVDYHLPPGDYSLQATGANAAVLRRLRVESTTNSLVRTGYRARHFADATQARRLVRAAAGVIGGPTADIDIAVFAPTVLVADRVKVDDRADGSADIVYRVAEPLKNAPAKGSELRFAVRGANKGPFPPPPQPGEGEMLSSSRVVLLLQPPETVIVPTGRPPLSDFKRITLPMPVEGERVLPGYHSMAPETTLSALRQAIRAQVCARGYAPVGKGGRTDIAC